MSDDLFENGKDEEIHFDDLVGEGKKFKDPDAIAKKVQHADQHIARLEAEQAELRAELKARLTLEDMMKDLPSSSVQPTGELTPTNGDEPGSQPKVDLAAEVQKLLRQEKDKETKAGNLAKVRTELKNRFGADYNTKLTSIAEDLGVSPAFLTDMANTSPVGLLKLVDSVADPDNKRPTTPPVPGLDAARNVNPNSVKNAAYYRGIRKRDPEAYFSSRVQKEMNQEAMRQGQAFYQ